MSPALRGQIFFLFVFSHHGVVIQAHVWNSHKHSLTLVFVSCLLSVVGADAGVRVCRAGEEMELSPSDLIKCESFSSAV